ncbi:hypothetical protein C0995_003333 [Termitomyces sp. Mi166|nr:hypothetical protein C0995_003333 [Termitomyces sp. Mi166\
MSTEKVNYAKILGVESVAAAIVFALAYLPLFVWFVRQSFGRPTYVFVVLSFFCSSKATRSPMFIPRLTWAYLVRIAAFTIRAVLAGSESAGENLGLFIADSVLFGVGFFALLYSAYTLVLDRWLLLDAPPEQGVLRMTRDRRLFRVVMLVAVILGIVGSSAATSSDPQNGNVYRTASTVIFLALTAVLAVHTIRLTLIEGSVGFRTPGNGTLGGEHGAYILCLIAALLLVREAFATATVGNVSKQNDEHLWYPLFALPEILAVMFYAIPGLVPPRSELPR